MANTQSISMAMVIIITVVASIAIIAILTVPFTVASRQQRHHK